MMHCDKHGNIPAQPCPYCTIDELRAEVERLQAELVDYTEQHGQMLADKNGRIAELEAEVARLREYERIYNRSKGERIAELEADLQTAKTMFDESQFLTPKDRAILDAAKQTHLDHKRDAHKVARIWSEEPKPCNCGVCVAVRAL